MKVPNVSKEKEFPSEQIVMKELPDKTPEKQNKPIETKFVDEIPNNSPFKEDKPLDVSKENVVVINNKEIEIKPTKLKYFRNKAVSGYNLIKKIPLQEFFTYPEGTFDERDSDKILYDFLVATFDNSSLVRDNYDDFDPEILDRIVKIFGRLNHIDEKEDAARKNMEAQAKH